MTTIGSIPIVFRTITPEWETIAEDLKRKISKGEITESEANAVFRKYIRGNLRVENPKSRLGTLVV